MKARVILAKVFVKLARLVLMANTILRSPRSLLDPSSLILKMFPSKQSLGSIESPKADSLLIIIPYKDSWKLTKKALESLNLQKVDSSQIKEVTVALVDNNSNEQCKNEVKSWVSSQGSDNESLNFKCFEKNYAFNFSKMNNDVFKEIGGAKSFSLVLLMNNDIELTEEKTLEKLVEVTRSEPLAGVVGSTLLYSDNRVQHSFLAPGVMIGGAHPLKGIEFQKGLAWFQSVREVPAVTGALMLIRSTLFEELNGLDEKLATAFQDLDFCLQIHSLGYVCKTIGSLTAVHHESQTRKGLPAYSETEYFYNKWGEELTNHPALPRSLSRWSERPLLSLGEPNFPWKWYY